MAKCRLLNFTR